VTSRNGGFPTAVWGDFKSPFLELGSAWMCGPAMFQIIFNELSAAEMAALPKSLQLDLLAEFQILPEDLDNLDSSRFGVIEREGKKLRRYRAKDYRIYFERRPEGITVHRVLHKNTFRDFLFRSKLPMAEDDQLGKHREFWKLIEQGERTRKTT
jgi:mRNA-degrading endonuclease RelE of RelBE toxin-antitoxin system